MAVITPTFSKIRSSDGGIDAIVISWGPLANGDTGKPVSRPALGDKSIQIEGTFGAGGTIVLEGSNQAAATNFRTMTDPAANLLSLTAAGLKQVTEVTTWVRPNVTAGDGSTSLTVTLVARRTVR